MSPAIRSGDKSRGRGRTGGGNTTTTTTNVSLWHIWERKGSKKITVFWRKKVFLFFLFHLENKGNKIGAVDRDHCQQRKTGWEGGKGGWIIYGMGCSSHPRREENLLIFCRHHSLRSEKVEGAFSSSSSSPSLPQKRFGATQMINAWHPSQLRVTYPAPS